MVKDSPTGPSLDISLGHQGDKITGGNDRVLFCANINLSLDYEQLHIFLCQFGDIERIKLKLATDKKSFVCYATFASCVSAQKANRNLNNYSLNDSVLRTKVYSTKSVCEEPFDFVPTTPTNMADSNDLNREPPLPIWYVASYKDGGENMIKASECIQKKVGNIPFENMKRYGKNILIKAGNESQAVLLNTFKPPQSGNIKSITPHRSFNTLKGIIYSRDLYEFSEEEILNRCPPTVYNVKKLRGNNNTILLFFSRNCPTYKFEQEVVEVANDNHISIGSAKRQVKGANKSPNSSYATAAKHLNIGKDKLSQTNVNKNARNASQPSTSRQNAPLSQVIGLDKNANQAPSQGPNNVTCQITSSHDVDLELLPDLSNFPTVNEPEQLAPVSTRREDPVEEHGKSISLELESSVITILKKTKDDDDGFSAPAMKKRARPTSPNNSSGITTSNKFAPLNESPLSKKKAVSMEGIVKEHSLPATDKVKDPSCRPKTAVQKNTLPPAKSSSNKIEQEKPSENKVAKSLIPSISKGGKSGSQKSKILKENLSLSSKDTSLPKSGKKS